MKMGFENSPLTSTKTFQQFLLHLWADLAAKNISYLYKQGERAFSPWSCGEILKIQCLKYISSSHYPFTFTFPLSIAASWNSQSVKCTLFSSQFWKYKLYSSNLLPFPTIIFAVAIDAIPKKMCYCLILYFNFGCNLFHILFIYNFTSLSISLTNASYLGNIFCVSLIEGEQEAVALCVVYFKPTIWHCWHLYLNLFM